MQLTSSGGKYSFVIGDAEIEFDGYPHWMEGQIVTTYDQEELDSCICYK